MKAIAREKDEWGEWVIYVTDCEKYEYEDPETPKNPKFNLHNSEMPNFCDIIDAVENYYYK